MKNLKSISLKSVYRTGDENLLEDFYLPTLECANSYDRAVGYFSTSLLEYALVGIASILKNDGAIRLIVGAPITAEEFEALQRGENLKYLSSHLLAQLDDLIISARTNLQKYRLDLFMLLVATNKLELRYAFKPIGMYHEKIGIIRDGFGNKVLFQGSANETTNAMHPDLNFESICVFKSWDESIYDSFAVPFESGFERLWEGKDKNVVTIAMPSDIYKKINEYYRDKVFLDDIKSKSELDIYLDHKTISVNNYPIIPSMIGNNYFKPFQHQELALRDWFNNGKIGILKLATGAGKTITAMYGVAKIFQTLPKPTRMLLIVAVPYQALAEQWVDELALFNMKPIQCFKSRALWDSQLNDSISRLQSGSIEFVSVVVVNKTLSSSRFQEVISRVSSDNIFFIGDECHRHATSKLISSLPSSHFIMGLSATPFIEDDEFNIVNEEKELLTSFYGNVVAEYSLADALADGVLTPYNYYLNIVYMSIDESEEYERLSKEIGRLMSIDMSKDNVSLSNSIRKRNKIVANASNKVEVLKTLLSSSSIEDKSHTLFYVGEGSALSDVNNLDIKNDLSQLESIANAVSSLGWKLQKFTSLENTSARKSIMKGFVSQDIDALVSMRVLDEGIDIPMCKRAFILASSRNSRQFIQRRGRILRKAKGKLSADIYDFVVLPNKLCSDSKYSMKLAERELTRVMEFVRLSKNRCDGESLAQSIADDFNICLETV